MAFFKLLSPLQVLAQHPVACNMVTQDQRGLGLTVLQVTGSWVRAWE